MPSITVIYKYNLYQAWKQRIFDCHGFSAEGLVRL